MKTICSFHFELSQKLKQLNIVFLITPLVKREAESIFLQSANFLRKYKIEQIQTCNILQHASAIIKTNLPYTSACSIFKSNLIIPLKESLKNISSCCIIFLTYIFFESLPFPLLTVRHIFEISDDDHPSLVTHARDI